jgi:hypothetical protein
VDTIQLQCGNCAQMMAISTAHQGTQVQCPHCQAIVQTPPPPAQLTMSDPGLPLPTVDLGERESIFGKPEPADDLFDGDEPPVDIPPLDIPPAPAPPSVSPHVPTVAMEAVGQSPAEYSPMDYSPPAPAALAEEPMPAAEDIGPIAPRRLPGRSMFVPILLIFLVPYAIFTTAFIGYLIWMGRQQHPLKMLPDNVPKGAPRQQVQHDWPLDGQMKVGLNGTIAVGDIEVTPLQVKRTAEGDLMLVFRARNLSDSLIFNPMADEYVRYVKRSMDTSGIYTFLERPGKSSASRRIYGGTLEWFKGPIEQPKAFDGDIGPGEEAIIHLTTDQRHRDELVPGFVEAREPLLWRLQVRRGLVPVDGHMVSATTVIGVEFRARDIVKEEVEG